MRLERGRGAKVYEVLAKFGFLFLISGEVLLGEERFRDVRPFRRPFFATRTAAVIAFDVKVMAFASSSSIGTTQLRMPQRICYGIQFGPMKALACCRFLFA